jgi:hypothetical protein
MVSLGIRRAALPLVPPVRSLPRERRLLRLWQGRATGRGREPMGRASAMGGCDKDRDTVPCIIDDCAHRFPSRGFTPSVLEKHIQGVHQERARVRRCCYPHGPTCNSQKIGYVYKDVLGLGVTSLTRTSGRSACRVRTSAARV